jgi:hypothetical protein
MGFANGPRPHRIFKPHVVIKLQVETGLLYKEASLDTMPVNCKIHRQTIGQGRVVLHVSGQLTGDQVNTLRTLLEQESSVLTLDLKDVRLADREAVRLLAIHESNGVKIDNCPLYIREWIRREREAT